MSTRATHIRLADTSDPADPPVAIPSPAQVRATADAIRETWTPRQRQRRAMTARLLEFEQLINEDGSTTEAAEPLAPESPLKPKASTAAKRALQAAHEADAATGEEALDDEPAILPFKPKHRA